MATTADGTPVSWVYLIGYHPPGEPEPTKAQITERMASCDCCFTVDGNQPWRIGEVITPDKNFGGPRSGAVLRLGTPYRCVAHERKGKIVIVVEVVAPLPLRCPEGTD